MRKILNKVCASTIASILAVSAMPLAFNSLATEDNVLSVSSQVISTDAEVDGTVIPAGSVAVTVSIANNAGFSSYSTKLLLGSAYDLILDENNRPIVESGAAIGDSRIGSSYNNNTVVVSMASASENTEDGEMFTIFASKDDSKKEANISVCENSPIDCGAKVQLTRTSYYRAGDVNSDNIINSEDASDVLAAVQMTGTGQLPYSIASLVPNVYFPNISDIRSAYIWSLPMQFPNVPSITDTTADEILDFYSCQSTGQPYTGSSYLGYYLG